MAIEIANIIHAIALVDTSVPLAPVLLAGDGFDATITRVGAGVYQLTTTLSLDFGEGLPFGSVPAYGANTPTLNARIVSDGVIEVVIAEDGAPIDPPYMLVCVMRYRSGQIPVPLLPPVIPGGGTLDIFVDPAGGLDTNPGTQALPIRTMAEAARRIPFNAPSIKVHLRSASYPLPDTGTWLGPRVFNGLVEVFGDQVWDPTVNNVLHSEAAGAGTTAILIKQTGLAVNAFRGKTLEVTHAGVVQRRTIKSNTATDVIPCETFSPVPIAGDAVRITESRAVIQLPPGGGSQSAAPYQMTSDVLGSQVQTFDGASIPPVDAATPQSGFVLSNVQIVNNSGGSFFGFSFGLGRVYFYGVEGTEAASGPLFIQVNGGQMFWGIGLADRPLDRGWGLGALPLHNSSPIAFANSALIEGYYAANMAPAVPQDGGKVLMWGGFSKRVFITAGFFEAFGNNDSLIPFTIDDATGSSAVEASTVPGQLVDVASLTLSFAVELISAGPAILVKNGGQCFISNTVTGGTTASGITALVEGGGSLWVEHDPVLGAVGDVWKTTNTAGVNKAALVAGAAVVDPTDTSRIVVSVP